MKRRSVISFLIIVFLLVGNFAFADEDFERVNVPLGSKQHVLFTFENEAFNRPGFIRDLEYDKANEHLYVILGNGGYETDIDEENNQFVYSLEGELVEYPEYPQIEGYERMGIEFNGSQAWALEYPNNFEPGDEHSVLINNFQDKMMKPSTSFYANGFAVQGNNILYFLKGCKDDDNFYVGSIDTMFVDTENAINGNLDYMKGYDFSADGEDVLYIGTEFGESEFERVKNYVARVDAETKEEIARFVVSSFSEDVFGEAYDLYTTEDHIVVLYKNSAESRGYIERYTYDGVRVDGVETNFCVRRIAEGPNGSTLYVQVRYDESEEQYWGNIHGLLEVVQIDWENKTTSRTGGPRHLVQEQTRAGLTVARFQDSQFGLLRAEDPETGIVDYRAPIRSEENLVRLQMPYCDVVAKLASGARNLVVEYKDQKIALPMTIFDCGDLLASMPCQDEATFEVILKADQAGNVSYQVQLFVVEEVNGMTKLVHRKTIQ